MRTAREKTEAATDVNKKPKKRKEPDGDGRGDREEENDSPALQAETGNVIVLLPVAGFSVAHNNLLGMKSSLSRLFWRSGVSIVLPHPAG